MTVLLHGFWGQPMDWNAVVNSLPLAAPLWIPDLYEAGPLSPNQDLKAWTLSFLEQLHSRAHHQPVQIVGYSMGGRLALSAFLQAPQMFKRVLILSAQPYIAKEAMSERQEWEQTWSERFLQEDWSQLEADWQGQSIFESGKELPRRKSASLREMLGLSLKNWSPTRHPFAEKEIRGLPNRVDWAFGALDQKYLQVAKQLQGLPVAGQIEIVQNAGHRLLVDAPQYVSHWVSRGE